MTEGSTNWDDGTFGAKLHELHRAGADWFPDISTEVAASVRQVHAVTTAIETVSREAGDPAALRGLLELRESLHVHLIKTVQAMAATGNALTAIAQDYLATDEKARADYERLQRSHPFDARPPYTGDTLPRPGDRPPGRPGMDYY